MTINESVNQPNLRVLDVQGLKPLADNAEGPHTQEQTPDTGPRKSGGADAKGTPFPHEYLPLPQWCRPEQEWGRSGQAARRGGRAALHLVHLASKRGGGHGKSSRLSDHFQGGPKSSKQAEGNKMGGVGSRSLVDKKKGYQKGKYIPANRPTDRKIY